ncbi:unnamed protein product [Vitrella brassicaformis CCMP3155]|uniref:HNH nuclease domain-containing protein n=1 Tax=Vitrella brassicaformis (strain CCMP3155) TaxID=1169540 RepID=A0A0G4G6T0_VITBC|nr:unnamed protein product [Vitrella brassicaformis CCMP3155]|eukprot:CEM24381.1 unnamed protein product [Vitrella brassicaformis CCMP3155]
MACRPFHGIGGLLLSRTSRLLPPLFSTVSALPFLHPLHWQVSTSAAFHQLRHYRHCITSDENSTSTGSPASARGVTKGRLESHGYYHTTITGKIYRVHRLIAETFLQEQKQQLINQHGQSIAEKLHVDHIDGRKDNNHVSNLQWLTPRQHGIKTRRTLPKPRNLLSSARKVIATHKSGEQQQFVSVGAAAEHFCVWFKEILFSIQRKRMPIQGWTFSHPREDMAVLPGEKFRSITSLRDLYKKRLPMVSNMGRIRHINGRLTDGTLDCLGYRRVNLGGYMLAVHRLVAEVFLHKEKRRLIEGGNEEGYLDVDHIDSNRCNSRLENLQWVTK